MNIAKILQKGIKKALRLVKKGKKQGSYVVRGFISIFFKNKRTTPPSMRMIGEDKQNLKYGNEERIWDNQWKIYICFAVLASVLSVLLAHVSKSESFQLWYHGFAEQVNVNKGIQYSAQVERTGEPGEFMTHYRYQTFGATNPEVVDVNAPMVALTFDDGPNPDYTSRILKVLEENYSSATFFVVGNNAEKYQETLQAIAASGSEIGNHTYSHINLTKISPKEVEEEIDKVNRSVKEATGGETTVIRPPYGAYDEELLLQLQLPVVLWDMDTEDWESRNAQVIANAVLADVSDGDIILMHDIYESTAEAVEILVPKLKEMGYQVVSVSKMAEYKGKSLELGKAYGGIKISQ